MALLQVENLVKKFPVRGGILNRIQGYVHAVSGVSFEIPEGQTLGVVGESGCGKSTLGKTVIRLYEPTDGRIVLKGKDITALGPAEMMPFRRKMQIIFQDPYSSLNPRLTINGHIKEAVRFHNIVPPGSATDDYIDEVLQKVGLRPEAKNKYPHEFSGGQRQRIGIARALCVKPDFVVADEPVSALDVSIQAQVLNLLSDLKEQFGLTMMFISHDLKVVEHFCDRILVMYLGHVVEELEADDLDQQAQHPYTKALLGANPIDDPDDRRPLVVLQGDVPSPYNPPKGCPFVTRCPVATERCRQEMPRLETKSAGHRVACFEVE
ncbi:MAG: ATP-binding cassette domain-containing protein [Planctomycetota bacterium]|nr:MAG: ATP-binding cassette domain-containing protein [Planctomycetota bacterium]